jgi:hypothetical protein
MTHTDCEFEAEVLAAVLQSRWPDRIDIALRDHAERCPICSDAAAIAGVIDTAREEMRPHAVVPDSGRVWFLARLRARREAARAATQPIAVTQLFAAAGAAGLMGACFGATSESFQSALTWLKASLAGFDFTGTIVAHGALALGAAAIVFLLPAVAWLAIRKE